MQRFIFFLTLIATLTCLNAQEPAAKIRVTFYTFSYAGKLNSVYLRTGSSVYQKIKLSTANMVGPVRALINQGVVSIHEKSINQEGDVTYPKVAVAVIPREVTSALIVLFPTNKKGDAYAYKALVIDKSETRFRQGSYKLVNASSHPIRGIIGKQTKFICPKGKIVTFRTKGKPGESLPVIFQFKKGERWLRLTETRWAHSEKGRTLLCVYLDRRTKRMRLRSIPDNTVKPAPRKASQQR